MDPRKPCRKLTLFDLLGSCICCLLLVYFILETLGFVFASKNAEQLTRDLQNYQIGVKR